MSQTVRIPSLLALGCLLSMFFATNLAFGQPADELSNLQLQLEQINTQIKAIQENKVADQDPFGQRVRSVGRQRTSAPPTMDDGTLTIRFYDLSDIFSVAPQYPARMQNDLVDSSADIFPIASSSGGSSGGGFGGGGGGVFNVFPGPVSPQQQAKNLSLSAARVSVMTLVKTIKEAVSPEEWDVQDGDASINVLGNTLLISATDSMHEQINNLLNLIREHWGKLKTVSIQAYWVKSNPSQVRELLVGEGDNRTVGKVDATKWQSFFQKANEENRVAYSASISGHNGQTLNTVSGRRRMMVVDAKPFYAVTGVRDEMEIPFEDRPAADELDHVERSVTGLFPVRNSFQEGAAIQVSPLATRGGNFVILDLHTRVNERFAPDQESKPAEVVARTKDGYEVAVKLDDANYVSYRLSTTIRCPKNEVILAGGMTYDAKQASDEPNLYLFVRARIHTIEEDQSDRKMD